MSVTVSIVSHGHGEMVWSLVEQLSKIQLISKIVVTLNIPEGIPNRICNKVLLIRNEKPIGFGANHNQAFLQCDTLFFCVLNPDIRLIEDPFQKLISAMSDEKIGLVAPRILDVNGCTEDSAREFLTPGRVLKRRFSNLQTELFSEVDGITLPDWVGGMFMLLRAGDYRSLGGFDESYFMYCEDADICTRVWVSGKKVAIETNARVIHDARRASRRDFRHMCWHFHSLMRYWFRYFGALRDARRTNLIR